MAKVFLKTNKGIKITDLETVIVNPAITPLTEEQTAFYEANPNASISEIKACKIVDTEEDRPSLEEYKALKMKEVEELAKEVVFKYIDTLTYNDAVSSIFIHTNTEDFSGYIPTYEDAAAKKIVKKYVMLRNMFSEGISGLRESVYACLNHDDVDAVYGKGLAIFSDDHIEYRLRLIDEE